MPFSIEFWKEAIKDTLRNMPGELKKGAYKTLSLATFLPLLAAFIDPAAYGTTVPALISILSGLGSNLLAGRLEGWSAEEGTSTAELTAWLQESLASDAALRAELDGLITTLQTIDTAQSMLSNEDKAWFHKTLKEELPVHSSLRNIYNQGGAYYEYVEVYGDLNVYNLHISEGNSPLIEAYYRSLSSRCQQLPLGILDKQFVDTRSESVIKLKDVYTALDVAAIPRKEKESDHQYGWRLTHAESGERIPLMKAITQEDLPYLVLLGDAGSGKTTFVNYLTYLILENPAELPEILQNKPVMRLVLREATKYLPKDESCGKAKMLWSAIRDDFTSVLGKENGVMAFTAWMSAICAQPCLLLLDGLDEVPESNERRKCLLDAIKDLVSSLKKGSRVIVTARPYAYAQKDWNLMDFQSLALAPFNRDQIKFFVRSWYGAIQCKGNEWTDDFIDFRRKDLLNVIFGRDYLGDLATRPVLLTLMATLHASNGELPEDRAELYENAVDLLIKRWQGQRVSGKKPEDDDSLDDSIRHALMLGYENLRKGLETVAYQAHVKQQLLQHAIPDANNMLESAEITRGELLEVFSKLFRNVNAADIIEYMEKRAGLLIAREDGVFIFPHRSFQEFLGACYLLNYSRDYTQELIKLLGEDQDWWREVYLLSVGRLKKRMQSTAIALIAAILPQSYAEIMHKNKLTEKDWEKPVLAGEALQELRLLEEPDFMQNYAYLVTRIREWLIRLVETGKLEPKKRLHAGDVLGKLGDSRKGVNTISHQGMFLPDIDWVMIPEGEFLMGSTRDDKQAYEAEKEQFSLWLPQFWISRYPLTNAQFEPFIKSEGYEEQTWWSVEGWAWRNGEDSDLTDIKDKMLRNTYQKALELRPIERRRQPYYWNSTPWNGKNRPVVGVNWFEAQAYTNWLTEIGKQQGLFNQHCATEVRANLPSEAEWEKAIRGTTGYRYPWGNQWKEDACNIDETELATSSVAGMFPKGCSQQFKVSDGAGNVWEWTRTIWGGTIATPEFPYPYNPGDGREDDFGWNSRVIRGGSWNLDQRAARCAEHLTNLPDYDDYSLGFRMVLSRSSSSFDPEF
jgi:formylglycine-generating enzyme required for sulfatase activity